MNAPKTVSEIETRIEVAVGDLVAALFLKAATDPVGAFHSGQAATSVIQGMSRDLIKTGRVKYEDM
jgi:hypothetical protein